MAPERPETWVLMPRARTPAGKLERSEGVDLELRASAGPPARERSTVVHTRLESTGGVTFDAARRTASNCARNSAPTATKVCARANSNASSHGPRVGPALPATSFSVCSSCGLTTCLFVLGWPPRALRLDNSSPTGTSRSTGAGSTFPALRSLPARRSSFGWGAHRRPGAPRDGTRLRGAGLVGGRS
jgi:hypothetical protein